MRTRYFAAGNWIIFSCLLLAPGCGGSDGESLPTASINSEEPLSLDDIPTAEEIVENPPAPPPVLQNLHPEVTIRTSMGEIRVRLDAEHAPETVDNFLTNYVKRDFYDGTIFHHVESEFILIGGGYSEDLDLKPTRAAIRSEAANGLKNKRGTIAMLRDGQYTDTATSQFFFNLADNPDLDHDPDGGDEAYGYCVFGDVIAGLEVLDKMAQVAVGSEGDFQKLPVSPITIESVEAAE